MKAGVYNEARKCGFDSKQATFLAQTVCGQEDRKTEIMGKSIWTIGIVALQVFTFCCGAIVGLMI